MTDDNGDGPVTRREFEQRLSEVKAPAVVDPTANVLQLVEAAMQRQDDLRGESNRRQSDLDKQERRHRLELRDLESKYRDAQQAAESRRLDALLAAQNSAAALTATRAEATATALAERVDNSAKTLATSVEATAKAFQTAVDATAKAFSERISPLEQLRFEQGGRREQQTETRATTQWTIERVMAVIVILLGGLYFVLSNAR